MLIRKRLTIQTTNATKDVANEGHISPEVMGILAQNIKQRCDPSVTNVNDFGN